MTRIINIAQRKGGVTKTTIAVNLAYELSRKYSNILIIDLDSQSDSSKFFSAIDTEFYVGDVLLNRKFDIMKAVYPAKVKGSCQENLSIICGRSGDLMSKLEMDMMGLQRREQRLDLHLSAIKEKFDFIIIDTSPSSNILMMNAVSASNEFIFPTDFSEHSLDGIETILDHIQDVKFIDENEINFLVVPSKVNKSAKKSLRYGKNYCFERFPNNTAKTYIWEKLGAFRNAELRHLPVSVAQPASEAAMYYKRFSEEVINNEI
ncbi:chromosomal partitioning protein (plasmid) [Candidatus Photodesmus blepharus]|uniref:Chromosomal partitioning protein n=1 Tax=Candidatus Photodesmus blepharonis TaxID=1179155 RepID=A0A084CNW4_9GAMM|nr:ParA family protein [Candidatus Photodesmus blepharus]KEY91493.1 chromosomal partitioning protein [Candidatus Photodesmus blepharus]